MPLDAVGPALAEPITLAQAKLQVRKTTDDEDALFRDILIPAARDRGELATQRQFVTRIWDLHLDDWPPCGWIDVPRAPLQGVVSITYLDTAGASQTLASSQYLVDTPAGERCPRGRITPAYNVTWPTVRDQANAITVRFTAGYGDTATSVPALLRQAMLRDIGAMYEHREDVITGTIATEMPRSSATVYRSFKSRPRQRSVAA